MFSRILFIIPIWLILDFYFFQSLKSVTQNLSSATRNGVHWAYWLCALVLFLIVLFLFCIIPKLLAAKYIFVLVGFVLLSLVPKLLVLPFLLLEDITRLGSYAWNFKNNIPYPERRKFIGQIILGVSAVPFLAIIYGMSRGKYQYK